MKKPRIIWLNALFLIGTPLAAIILVPAYAWFVGFDLFEWSIFGAMMLFTGISITAGYHRLWAHQSYEARAPLRAFLALFGAAALQNTILHWASDHRRHHRYVDNNERDPYSAKRGFWFSHMGWIFRKYPATNDDFSNVRDLEADPIVRWQHRGYLLLLVLINLVVPLALGYAHGKLFGVLILASLLRIVLNHHLTFLINSLAHIWGTQPYSRRNTARDNPILAFLTYGEGYHNFHHRFSADYRNGVRWWQFDPSKWFIRVMSWLGQARNLKAVSRRAIEEAVLRPDQTSS